MATGHRLAGSLIGASLLLRGRPDSLLLALGLFAMVSAVVLASEALLVYRHAAL